MAILLKSASVRVSFIQIMQIRVQNKMFGKVDTMEMYQVLEEHVMDADLIMGCWKHPIWLNLSESHVHGYKRLGDL